MTDSTIEAKPSTEQPPLSGDHSPTDPSKRRNSDPFTDWEPYRDSKIEVQVGKPVLREEMITKFFVYKIQGSDLKGSIEVSRRYSDFEKVRQLLVKRWPGCFIPSLPPKKLNNTTKALLEDRTKHLNAFCKKIATIPHLHYSDVYQAFVKTRTADIDQLLQAYQKVKCEDIIERYTVVFSHLADKYLSNDTTYKIMTFKLFLQKAQGQFEKFKKIGKNFVKARKHYTNELVVMHNMMSDDYEQNIFSEYLRLNKDKHVFLDSSNDKSNKGIETVEALQPEDSIVKLYDWIKHEGRDIEAFIEAFEQKEKYDKKRDKAQSKQKTDLKNLSEGKVPLKMIFKARKNKFEALAQIEEKIVNKTKDVGTLSTLQDLITGVLAHEEIDKFKANRVEKYHEIVGQVTKHERKTFNAILNYWDGLLENANIKSLDTKDIV